MAGWEVGFVRSIINQPVIVRYGATVEPLPPNPAKMHPATPIDPA